MTVADVFDYTISYAEQVDNRFRYAGEQYDTVSGLIYLRARYYDPSIGRFTQEDPYRGDGLNLYTYVSNNPVKYINPTGLAKCAAAKNYDKALDGLQMVLDIGGFVPGIGDVLDAVNLGISIFRGNVLDSVFSAIAIAPGIGSAISTPLKAIFNAVGNASEITKSVTALGILFGGTSKIVSSLDGVSKSLKAFAKKIPTLISSLKNNYVLKTLIGKKQLDKIVSGVRSGVNSLISRTTQVISKVKTAVKKNIKETSKTYALCFTEETLIKTDDGHKQIKDIKVGDRVYSENVETGEKGYKTVKQVFVNDTDTLMHITVKDTVIKTTFPHPFYVVGKGWIEARDLQKGDVLKLANGEKTEVKALKVEELESTVEVYNFEVEDWHTYFVSEDEVLVHNTGSNPCATNVKSFEQMISKMSPSERVAAVRTKASQVASSNGFIKESKLTKINGRDVYRDPKTGNLYAVDSQHGRFEQVNGRNGKHMGEIDFDFNFTKPADKSGGHNLRVK